ncbi:hypothetical protein [Myroides sp. DF42-4-2]|uniref:hypothetical protein n=1 Tax=Myroides sp. DF42-4-2 TaxID=2746726 RepID=UPI002577A7B4|nr:hypothetical protein [Myroides sp. DF42-4-2]MDM1407026.1 hypothetical protein [Myroides sp. DF42-4-2]
MLSTDKITEIYYEVDDFFKAYSNVLQSHSIEADSTKKKRSIEFAMVLLNHISMQEMFL